MSDRLLTGIIAGAVIIVIGTLAWRSQLSGETVTATTPEKAVTEEEARSTQFRARIEACRREKDDPRTFAEGYIENIGNAEIRYVTLEVRWLNRLGEVIESNEIYVLRDEVLAPGARKRFVSTTGNRVAVSCNVRKVDWW